MRGRKSATPGEGIGHCREEIGRWGGIQPLSTAHRNPACLAGKPGVRGRELGHVVHRKGEVDSLSPSIENSGKFGVMLFAESPQLPVTTKQSPKATGDLWQPSVTNPTTVPVPLPVVVVRVDGPFTALDRKLWLALVHIAFPNLESQAASTRSRSRKSSICFAR